MNFKTYRQIVESPTRQPSPPTERVSPPRRDSIGDPLTTIRQKRLYSSPSPQRSPQKKQPVWEYLYEKARENRNKMLEKHQMSKHRIETECTFQPILVSSKRFMVPSQSNFLERNQIWQDNRIQHIVDRKVKKATDDYRQCTFQPQITQKGKKAPKDRHLQIKDPMHWLKKRGIPVTNENSHSVQIRKFSPPQKIPMQQVKAIIRHELKKIAL